MNAYDTIAGLEPFAEHPRPGEVGWKLKINFKKLGRTLKKVARSKVIQGAIKAGAAAMSNPAVATALGIPPQIARGIQVGAAALLIQKRAEEGDPQAQAVYQQAMRAEPSEGSVIVPSAGKSSQNFSTCPVCGS